MLFAALSLPPSLQPYQPFILMALTFVDGLLFGLAIKKGVVSFVLLIIAIFIGTYVGISLPGVSVSNIISEISSQISALASQAPQMFAGVSIFFLIGLAIGIWKG